MLTTGAAHLDKRRPANQPKPNTRFLNNIIRDTNSHNRALLAKENAESQARLRELEEAEQEKRREEERRLRKTRPGPSDTRKRMLGDIAAHLGGPSKKRRAENTKHFSDGATSAVPEAPTASHRSASDRRTRHGTRKDGDEKPTDSSKERRTHSDERHRVERTVEKNQRSRREHGVDGADRGQKDLFAKIEDIRRSNHREKSHKDDDRRRSRGDGERSHRHRHRSPRRRDELYDKDEDDRLTPKSKRRHLSPPRSHRDESDSDPLDDIIGPAPAPAIEPAVRRRGRGVTSGASGIDSRFAADYDPKLDVTPEPDDQGSNNSGKAGGGIAGGAGGEADWDNAVEAFRDRVKWRQQGAERLRSAGFSEEEIRKWEKGGQKDESDVRWNDRGGLREWDRGKVVDDDGQVSLEPEWGRLKGT